MKNFFLSIIGLALMLAVISCDKDDPILEVNLPSENPQEAVNRGYVYATNESGSFEIWKFEEDAYRQLTDDESMDSWWPRYDNQNDRILYYRSKAGREVNDYANADLMIMNSDGTNEQMIMASGSNGWDKQGLADWSHDGKKLVMAAFDPDIASWQIFVSDDTGEGVQRISTRNDVNYLDPVFGIDDAFIYCVTIPEGVEMLDENYEVVRLSLDKDSLEERLTFNNFRDQHPHVSPDGKKVVFESLTDPNYLSIGKWTIHELDIESAKETELINNDNINLFPRYSVDGKKLFYSELSVETFAMSIARYNFDDKSSSTLVQGEYNNMNVDPY